MAKRDSLPSDYVFRRTELPNGVRIISEFLPTLPSCAIGVWVDAGSRDESSNAHGITHFIEHAVFKGTESRTARRIAQELESVGGYLNAFTAKDVTCFYARIMNRHAEVALGLLADLMLRPLFRPQDVEKEKRVIIEELRSVEDDPEDVINDHFEQALFGEHPLAHPVLGTEASIATITPEALRDYVTRRYRGRALVVACAGGVEHERLVEICSRLFGDVPAGQGPHRLPPSKQAPAILTLTRAVQQVHVVEGLMVPGITHPDSDAFSVLSVLCGESMSSRLFQRIRERHGYAYTVYSALSWFKDVGVFSVYFSADPKKEDKCQAAVAAELEGLHRTPVRAPELRRAREQVIGGALLGLESMESRMNRIARDELWFEKYLPLDEWIHKIESITSDDVHRVALLACDTAHYHRVVIRPAKAGIPRPAFG